MTANRAYDGTPWVNLVRVAAAYPDGSFYNDIALRATRGRLTARQLIAATNNNRIRPFTRDIYPAGIVWFADATAARVDSPSNVEDAYNLFRLAYTLGGQKAFRARSTNVWLQCAALLGRYQEVTEIARRAHASGEVWWAAYTDEMHPGRGANLSITKWLKSFNMPLTESGLSPIHLKASDRIHFGEVSCFPAETPPINAPLISVVMPVYNPDENLQFAVESILNQSWQNLEIIICDDASKKNADLIHKLATLDNRIRVVTLDRNQGAYAARNAGVAAAKGEYITFNDADDWSHPDRLVRHYDALINHPNAFASLSQSIRVTSELNLTVIGRPPKRPNLSSIFAKRHVFIEKFGAFDGVRRGGDSELISRIETAMGEEAIVRMNSPLALVQLTEGSLSRADYRHLYTHPARLQYRDLFRNFHRHTRATSDQFNYTPGERPKFPAPSHILGAKEDSNPPQVDILMLGDLTGESGVGISLEHEVEHLSAAGLETAVMEYLSPLDIANRRKTPSTGLLDLIRTEHAKWLIPETPVETNIAVIRDYRAVLSMPSQALSSIDAKRVVVVASDVTTRFDAKQATECERIIRKIFKNAEVLWQPTDRQTQRILRKASLGARIETASFLYPRITPIERIYKPKDISTVGVWIPRINKSDHGRIEAWLKSLRTKYRFDDCVILTRGTDTSAPPRGCTLKDVRDTQLAEFLENIDVLAFQNINRKQVTLTEVSMLQIAAARSMSLFLTRNFSEVVAIGSSNTRARISRAGLFKQASDRPPLSSFMRRLLQEDPP